MFYKVEAERRFIDYRVVHSDVSQRICPAKNVPEKQGGGWVGG